MRDAMVKFCQALFFLQEKQGLIFCILSMEPQQAARSKNADQPAINCFDG
jgi:hypothetical protein